MSTISSEQTDAESWLELVRRKAAAIRFGSVQITVHDGRVTLVESIEKTRIASDRPAPGARVGPIPGGS